METTNQVLTELKLRTGEIDVRQLSEADMNQINYRFMNDMLTIMNNLMTSMVEIEVKLDAMLTPKQQEKIKRLVEKSQLTQPKE